VLSPSDLVIAAATRAALVEVGRFSTSTSGPLPSAGMTDFSTEAPAGTRPDVG